MHHEKVVDWDGSANGLWCTESVTKQHFPHLRWIRGRGGHGWSEDPNFINYGGNSGFQILNIAFLLGLKYIVLIGFNLMAGVEDGKPKAHFFGNHPQGLNQNSSYHSFAAAFKVIRPERHGVTIVNTANPTKLTAFPRSPLELAISNAP